MLSISAASGAFCSPCSWAKLLFLYFTVALISQAQGPSPLRVNGGHVEHANFNLEVHHGGQYVDQCGVKCALTALGGGVTLDTLFPRKAHPLNTVGCRPVALV